MKVVYKYELKIPNGPPGTHGKVELPATAKILKIDFQAAGYYVWCLVDTQEKEITKRWFIVAGTGHTFEASALRGLEYIDTVITLEGRLVFHFWMER